MLTEHCFVFSRLEYLNYACNDFKIHLVTLLVLS